MLIELEDCMILQKSLLENKIDSNSINDETTDDNIDYGS